MFGKEPAVILGALSEVIKAIIPMLIIFGFINWSGEQVAQVMLVVGVAIGFLNVVLTRSQVVATDVADKQIRQAVKMPADTTVAQVKDKVEARGFIALALSLVLSIGGVAALGTATLTTKSCNKNGSGITKEQGIAFAKDIASGLRSAQPVVAQLSPDAGKILERAIPIADQVITAVQASDAVTVAALLNDLLPLINQVVAQFTSNVKVMAFIALADIGIHFLINHATEIFGTAALVQVQRERARARSGSDALAEYAQRPAWGCQYQPEKCKNLMPK